MSMFDKKLINDIVTDEIKDSNMFLVELTVSLSNTIIVVVDAAKGVDIGTCIKLSKSIESRLDREAEDFELSVMSSGIGQEFKVLGQFEKNIGNNVEILTREGKKAKGKLILFTETEFEIETEEMVKVEGKKKKQLEVNRIIYKHEDIKSIKDIITF